MRKVSILDVAIMAAVALFSIVALSHIAQTWLMRRDLQVHMRSPGLATLSGLSGVLLFFVTVFRFFLGLSTDEGVIDLFLLPILMLLYTGAYVMRGVRLLVMYNPRMRLRWRWCVKEAAIMKTLVVSCFILEAIVWSSSAIFGVHRVAYYTLVLFISDTLVTIGASFVLFGKLRKTNDIYKMSVEIRKLGAFALLALCSSGAYVAVPSPYFMLLWMMVRFQSALWITNIQPIRAILRRRTGLKHESGSVVTLPLFPYLPWKKQPSRQVAIDAAAGTVAFRSHHTSRMDAGSSALDMILHVPPLLQAFEAFCRKALCSESLMFLLAVEGFRTTLDEAPTTPADCHQQFMAIVDKYIRDRSPYEVNIEGRTKHEVLRKTDRGVFDALAMVDKSEVLDPAAKEVGRVLKDNLCDKFCDTQDYKQIREQLLVIEEEDGE